MDSNCVSGFHHYEWKTHLYCSSVTTISHFHCVWNSTVWWLSIHLFPYWWAGWLLLVLTILSVTARSISVHLPIWDTLLINNAPPGNSLALLKWTWQRHRIAIVSTLVDCTKPKKQWQPSGDVVTNSSYWCKMSTSRRPPMACLKVYVKVLVSRMTWLCLFVIIMWCLINLWRQEGGPGFLESALKGSSLASCYQNACGCMWKGELLQWECISLS